MCNQDNCSINRIDFQHSRKGIKEAYYLPIKIQISEYGCPYPMARQEDWLKVCGPADDNCYAARTNEPVFLDRYEDADQE